MSQQQHNYNYTIVFGIATLTALAGLLFGLDIGIVSGARHFIQLEFHLTTHQEEWVVSSILLGAVIGVMLANPISHKFGRQRVLLAAATIFTLGSLLSAAATSYTELVWVRIGLGLALGFASFTAPVYLAEIAPKRIRGALVSFYQLMLTLGILGAFLIGVYFSHSADWRSMLGIIALPAMLMLVGVAFLPQSPQWLMLVNRRQEAYHLLFKIFRNKQAVENELNDIEFNLKRSHKGFKELMQPYFRRVLLLGISLQCIQIITGMNTMMYYAPKIFEMAGYATPVEQMWGTVILGVLNVVTTILSVLIIDRWGRRPLLFFGLSFMTLGMLLLGTAFYFDITPESFFSHHHILAGMLSFIFGFAISLGPVIWLMCSEIFPLRGKDIGVMCTTMTNWVFSFLLAATFLSILESIGPAQTFWILTAICVVSSVIIYFFLPETKGVPLETIEKRLVDGEPLRYIGRARGE